MKILVVHEVSYEKKVVYEYQDFAERLAKMGHEVCVIDYDAGGDGVYHQKRVSKSGIAEVTLENTPYVNLPLVKYFSGRWNYKKLLEKKLKNREVDVVFLYSVFISGTSTIRLCRKYKVPVVYRVLDVYHRIRQDYLMMGPLWLGERFIYRHADLISLTNEKMLPYVQKMAGGEKRCAPAWVLHHGVDTDFFKPEPRNKDLAAQWGIKDSDQVLLFLGTTYTFSGLDVVIDGFAKLKEKSPQLKLVVVGGGEQDGLLQQKVAAMGLKDQVVLTGFRPYSEVPAWINLADVTFNSFYINDITRDIIPIKMLQYLACAKPVVCAPIPDVMRLFPEEKSGMMYAPIEDAEKYLSLLSRVLTDQPMHRRLSENGLRFIRENFAMNRQIPKLEEKLREIYAKHNC